MSPEVSTPDPVMAAELAPLRDASYPLQPLNLPNVRMEGGSVFYSTMTTDSTNSPAYQKAFDALRSNGCEVKIDLEGAENFVGVQIRVPEGVLSERAVLAICESIARQAEAQSRTDATPKLDPNEGAAGR